MGTRVKLGLRDLEREAHILLPKGSYVEKLAFTDSCGSEIGVVTIFNGRLRFTVLLERGMDIGDIFYQEEKVSWERDTKFLLHPDNVDLFNNEAKGWLNGFYGAVASIGPEVFAAPAEGYTIHGTGSYSQTRGDSVSVEYDDCAMAIEGVVPVKGYGGAGVFEKRIRLYTQYDSEAILREETTQNLTDAVRVLDDGLHIQLSGSFMQDGGEYVLPVQEHEMLLRDSAEKEMDAMAVKPLKDGKEPIRCYQYVPERVRGLESIAGIAEYLPAMDDLRGITAEMLVSNREDTAAYVIRPLKDFPRSLVAKENGESFMFCFEPCRTRPNRMSQKITDGEVFYLQPHLCVTTRCLIGVTKNREAIKKLGQLIVKAAQRNR